MSSIYENRTAAERLALAKARRPGEEAPRCAAFFDHDDECDIPMSHVCGPSEIALAYAAMWAEIREEASARAAQRRSA